MSDGGFLQHADGQDTCHDLWLGNAGAEVLCKVASSVGLTVMHKTDCSGVTRLVLHVPKLIMSWKALQLIFIWLNCLCIMDFFICLFE